MRMKLSTILVLMFTLTLGAIYSVSVTEDQKSSSESLHNSEEAARSWLALVDKGEYQKSWDEASFTFRLTVPGPRWVMLMGDLRKPLGQLKSRELLDQFPSNDPQGLPKGEYMVLIYRTSFTQKPKAHEMLTLVLESDGKWRVLTYQVQ